MKWVLKKQKWCLDLQLLLLAQDHVFHDTDLGRSKFNNLQNCTLSSFGGESREINQSCLI